MTTYHTKGFLRGARGDFHEDIEAPDDIVGEELIIFFDKLLRGKYGEIYGMITEYCIDIDGIPEYSEEEL